MRTAFIETLLEMARTDDRITLVVGDLGFGVVNRFMEELPGQFVNAGVAEQNMTGLAAGLALSGKIVVTYSIANFPILRCLEQVRNDVCYHNANVKIVSVGGGMSYGALGPSHHATEDIAIARTLPNMTVVAPNDSHEASQATRAVVAKEGPCYLRLGRRDEGEVRTRDHAFALGRATTIRKGSDLTLIVTGGLLDTAMRAAESLAIRKGLSARVLSLHTIKPLDEAAIISAAAETGAIFTIEEHSVIGGLGGAVAEVLMESDQASICFRRLGVPSIFSSRVGDQNYLRAAYGLDPASIVSGIEAALAPRSTARTVVRTE